MSVELAACLGSMVLAAALSTDFNLNPGDFISLNKLSVENGGGGGAVANGGGAKGGGGGAGTDEDEFCINGGGGGGAGHDVCIGGGGGGGTGGDSSDNCKIFSDGGGGGGGGGGGALKYIGCCDKLFLSSKTFDSIFIEDASLIGLDSDCSLSLIRFFFSLF